MQTFCGQKSLSLMTSKRLCVMSMRRTITAAKMTPKVLAKVNPMKVIAMTKMGIKIDNITLLVLHWS